jgi:hypothetical protein
MRYKITPADYWIEITTAAIVVALHIFGVISLAVALLGLVVCLSISLPYRRRSKSKVRNLPQSKNKFI